MVSLIILIAGIKRAFSKKTNIFDSVQDTKNQGYSPCGVCRPPQ